MRYATGLDPESKVFRMSIRREWDPWTRIRVSPAIYGPARYAFLAPTRMQRREADLLRLWLVFECCVPYQSTCFP